MLQVHLYSFFCELFCTISARDLFLHLFPELFARLWVDLLGLLLWGDGGTGIFEAIFRLFVEGMTNTYSFPYLKSDMQMTPPLRQKAKKN